jgi:hypothetical protein
MRSPEGTTIVHVKGLGSEGKIAEKVGNRGTAKYPLRIASLKTHKEENE